MEICVFFQDLSVIIHFCNKGLLLLFLVILIISIFIHVFIILSIDIKKCFISLKIVRFIIFQSTNCCIIFITTTSGSLPVTEAVVNTKKVKPITLH